MSTYPWNLRLTDIAYGTVIHFGWQALADVLTRHHREGYTAGELETIFGPDCREAYRIAAERRKGAQEND